MGTFDEADLDRFRDIIARRLGLQFDDGKKELLADVLQQRLKDRGCARPAAYLGSVGSATNEREELRALAAQLTVTETFFFRGSEQFQALTEATLPERIAARSADRRLRLLSAGCASGDEAYSLAILLRERFPELRSWSVEILGLDLNPAMIAKARRAHYNKWSLRDTPDELRDKYFRMDGADFVLAESIRSMACFEEQNLAGADWANLGEFDLVLCRNVIMYLIPEAAQSVIQRLTQALAPEGFLFLGYAETLRGLSHDFQLRHTNDAFYYQKRADAGAPAVSIPEAPPVHAPSSLVDLPDIAWVDAVRRASERIDRLSRDCAGRIAPPPKAVGRAPVQLGFAFELLRQERFREALDVLRNLPPEAGDDPDVQLLRAGLLTNCGDLEAAEAVCRKILSADDLNAGAHYLTALCRERAGDTQGAMEHDRAAIYLDDAFAMPHLHLGRMAKRSADSATARHELEHAGMLLSREDPSRILLFGGGFSREALVAFSRAELRACGGSS
jgi:chemotaxis protein methyltransferase CheR